MYQDFSEFLDHLYNRTAHTPAFVVDLVKLISKDDRFRGMPDAKPSPAPVTDTKPLNIKDKPTETAENTQTLDNEEVPEFEENDPINQNITPHLANNNNPTPDNYSDEFHLPFIENIEVKDIKSLVVVHKSRIMKFGETTVPAPLGVNIDPKTGELTVPIEIIPVGDAILKPKVEKNLLINEGFIKLKTIAHHPDLGTCPNTKKCFVKETTIPVQSVHEIKGIRPGDKVQEKVEVKSISVMGIPDNSMPKSAGQKINLLIKIILEVKVVIAREEIISVLSCKSFKKPVN
ncbi:hypothetical protein [Desulfofalx alkaliphila]|uniref:hypothetical protein n=1 Tax=Desulfofalx alkaliphila TaxID=105483 RepID=UPI0004E0FB47|nr:hypothetical protein [Desulfofalx alkaliphila]